MGGGEADLRHAVYIVAALAGSRMTLVSTGWTASHLVCTNHSSPLVRTHFLFTIGNFQSEGGLADRRALSIESLLLSGLYTPRDCLKEALNWFKFPVLHVACSRSEGTHSLNSKL